MTLRENRPSWLYAWNQSRSIAKPRANAIASRYAVQNLLKSHSIQPIEVAANRMRFDDIEAMLASEARHFERFRLLFLGDSRYSIEAQFGGTLRRYLRAIAVRNCQFAVPSLLMSQAVWKCHGEKPTIGRGVSSRAIESFNRCRGEVASRCAPVLTPAADI